MDTGKHCGGIAPRVYVRAEKTDQSRMASEVCRQILSGSHMSKLLFINEDLINSIVIFPFSIIPFPLSPFIFPFTF